MMSSDTYGRHSPPSNNHYERYKGILVSMMESVLQKVQLHFNIDELREIDNDTVDDDVRIISILVEFCELSGLVR